LSSGYFRIQALVPLKVTGLTWDGTREEFFSWLWSNFESKGLSGVWEGSWIDPDETKSSSESNWTLDAGEAPRDRDWVGDQDHLSAELYFSSEDGAKGVYAELQKLFPKLSIQPVQAIENKDWNAEWRKSFHGVEVPPFWKVVPYWEDDVPGAIQGGLRVLKINPGAGFGTGTHETTQLCLGALGEVQVQGKRVLDFGSGSGILSVAAALLGASVDGVEIDSLAIDNARENAEFNRVDDSVKFMHSLDEVKSAHYPVIIANILKNVLLKYSSDLCSRLEEGGTLILSGLLERDLKEILSAYSSELQGRGLKVSVDHRALGEWQALVFRVSN
jgi:ribosomal protein L11 methyltransferase